MYFRYYKFMLHINTYQCKNPIVPEEGWFGQPKYGTPKKIILRCVGLCFCIFFIYMWSRLDQHWSNVYQQDHRSGCLLKNYSQNVRILWHAVCSRIQSSQIFIQSNHFGVMQFNLIFQTYSNNPKKHSIHTHVSQFNLIRVNIHSIQVRKYLFNPRTEIYFQSKHENIYSIQSLKYICNPFAKVSIEFQSIPFT